jgi:hypothetical protein
MIWRKLHSEVEMRDTICAPLKLSNFGTNLAELKRNHLQQTWAKAAEILG